MKGLWYKYEHNFKGEFVRKVLIKYEFENTNLELYESNLLPLLRAFHVYSISPSGWISFKLNSTKKPNIKNTTNLMISQLIKTGKCDLPLFHISSIAHIKFLKSIRKKKRQRFKK